MLFARVPQSTHDHAALLARHAERSVSDWLRMLVDAQPLPRGTR